MEERYQLIELLGSGGMASVHRARDRLLDREVAIKRLLPHLAVDPAAAERFRREAQAVAGLNHPGIVTVYDTGVGDAGPYIVMEMIEGDTLAAKIAAEGPLGVSRTAAIVRAASEALDHAHANGVVHRDVKPSNLIVDENGGVRLTDFGIARAVGDPTLVTSTGELVGTLAYIAPEILAGSPATIASDVYSLGAVAYEMLTGRPPHQADNIAALITRIREEPPMPMGREVPDEVAAGVLRALSKDPVQRHGTAGALATALMAGTTLPLQADTAPTAPIPAQAPDFIAPVSETPSGDEEPTRVLAAETRRSGASARVPLLLFMALALVLAIAVLAPGRGDIAATTPTTTTTTTTSPTTTTTLPTTTTLAPNSPEALALAISQLLVEMEPGFDSDDLEEIAEALDKVLQEAGEGDRQELGDSLEKAIEEVERLPESSERLELRDLFVQLAESYGFTVRERGDNGGDEDD